MSNILGLLGSAAGAYFGGPAGAQIGGMLGGAIGGDSQTNGGAGTQSSSRDPWGPAQAYMRQGLDNTSQLQKFYNKTPFNPQQIQQYSNLFNDIGNFRENIMPGLMNFSNAGMSQGYQRGGSTLAPSQQAGMTPFSVRQPAGLLDLNGPQYNPGAAIEQRNATGKQAPMTAMVGQSQDPVWEKVLSDWEKEHIAKYGQGLHNSWSDYADPDGTMAAIRGRYMDALGG